MNRLAQIEEALRDLAAAHEDEDWEAMAAIRAFDADGEVEEPVDVADATALLSKIDALLSVLTQEARVVRDELDTQPRARRAARAYLTADAAR